MIRDFEWLHMWKCPCLGLHWLGLKARPVEAPIYGSAPQTPREEQIDAECI